MFFIWWVTKKELSLQCQTSITKKNKDMMTLENIQDTIEIKEVMDNALSHLYKGISFDRSVEVFGKKVFIYTENGLDELEVIISSPSLDCAYVLDNSFGTQVEIINELSK